MAKIEMDISEYDIMRENKKLLEDSILKQKELQSQINLLTQEKIKALEDAKMKVIKISKSFSGLFTSKSHSSITAPSRVTYLTL